MRDWAELILRVGEEDGHWPGDRELVSCSSPPPAGRERGARAQGRLREARARDRLAAPRLLGGRRAADDRVVRGQPRQVVGRVDWTLRRPHRSNEGARHRRLGVSRLASRRAARGEGHEVVVPRSADYDLTHEDDAARLFRDTEPEIVFHLAALAGGIGANRAAPGRFWHANLLMGTHVLEQSRLAGRAQARPAGDDLLVPEAHARAVPRGGALERLSRRRRTRRTASRRRRCSSARRRIASSTALNVDHPAPSEPLRAARQLRPRDVARHPGADPPDARGAGADDPEVVLWGDGTPTREFLYVEDCAEGIALAARALRRRRAGEPRLGRGDLDPRPRRARRRADRLRGPITWDSSKPNGQPRRLLDTTKAAELFRLSARTTSLRDGPRAHDRLVPRARIRRRVYGAARLARRRPGRGTASRSASPGALLVPAARRPLARARRLHDARQPQRLALLPGRRPDLVLDDELAARPRLDHGPARLPWLVDAPGAVHVDRRRRIPWRLAVRRCCSRRSCSRPSPSGACTSSARASAAA